MQKVRYAPVYSRNCAIGGGQITGNEAANLGGAVYVVSRNFRINGAPVIKDNTAGAAGNNVCLGKNGSTQTVITFGTLNLTSKEPIGITMAEPGVFTSGMKNRGTAANFTSDDGEYSVAATDTYEAQLVTHAHDINYEVVTVNNENDTIKATCNAASCDLHTNGASLTLVPTEKTAYDPPLGGGMGIVAPSDWKAALTGIDEFYEATGLLIEEKAIKYYNTENGAKTGDALSAVPYQAGTYCAEITAGTAAASVIYTIKEPKYPGIPTACIVGRKTDTSLTITQPAQYNNTYEYKIDDGEWTTNPTFTGLEPHSEHTLSVRMKEHLDDTVKSTTVSTYYTVWAEGKAKVGETLTVHADDLPAGNNYYVEMWITGEATGRYVGRLGGSYSG